MKIKVLDRVFSAVLLVALMITIFCFSAQNAASSNGISGGFIVSVARFFNTDFESLTVEEQAEIIHTWQHFVRKTAHFCEYALLGFLAANALRTYRLYSFRRFLLPVVICFIYAISDEVHQYFVPGRSCQLADVVLDTAGGIFGTVFFLTVAWIVKKMIKRRKCKNDTQD